MTRTDYEELALQAQRRPLSPEENATVQEFWAEHPEARLDWEQETSLTNALNLLAEPPLSSNFTARVMASVRQLEGQQPRISASGRAYEWLGWLSATWATPGRRVAAAALAALLLLGTVQWRSWQERQMVDSLSRVDGVIPLSTDVLQNADAIARALPPVDTELIAALQLP